MRADQSDSQVMLGLLFAILGGTTAGYAVSRVALSGARAELQRQVAQGRRQVRTLAPAQARRIINEQMRRTLAETGVTRARVDAAYALARRAGLV